jgi:hypothetical protein
MLRRRHPQAAASRSDGLITTKRILWAGMPSSRRASYRARCSPRWTPLTVSRVRRSWSVSSLGGLAGSSSPSRRRRISSCPIRVTFLSKREDAPAWSAWWCE